MLHSHSYDAAINMFITSNSAGAVACLEYIYLCGSRAVYFMYSCLFGKFLHWVGFMRCSGLACSALPKSEYGALIEECICIAHAVTVGLIFYVLPYCLIQHIFCTAHALILQVIFVFNFMSDVIHTLVIRLT